MTSYYYLCTQSARSKHIVAWDKLLDVDRVKRGILIFKQFLRLLLHYNNFEIACLRAVALGLQIKGSRW